jgi:hypothetical protein
MKSLFTFCCILITGAAIAQNDFRPINRDSVKIAVTDSTKETWYPKLFDRFNHFDTTLTKDDYRLLYYGFVFQDIYSGYAADKEGEIVKLINKRTYDKASDMCDEVLVKMPVGLKANLYKSLVLGEMAVTDSARKYADRYLGLMGAVLSSGNGFTCETAFKTIFVSDEYDVIRSYFQMNSKGQSLQYPCDKLFVTKSKYFDKNAIYFDTSETFIRMREKTK